MPTNNFLPFAIGGGANVQSQGVYAADPLQGTGNQPGIAISAFNNKAIRQASVITSQMAQFIANTTGTDVLDDTQTTKLLAQVFAAFSRKAPVLTTHLSGSGNHNLTYKFQVASANATATATYSDGTTIFTVSTTISSGLELIATGGAAPVVSGTLTKTGGTGDASITYYAVRAPLYMRVRMAGGGGGGSGAGVTPSQSPGGNGGNTTFGTTLLVANGGTGGVDYGSGTLAPGGSASLGTGPAGITIVGTYGGGTFGATLAGGFGGVTAFGGASAMSQGNITPIAPSANSGCGGTGGAGGSSSGIAGTGGGAGGYVDAVITSLLSVYAWAVGAAGTAGASPGGSNAGTAGAAGAAGIIIVEEFYQ